MLLTFTWDESEGVALYVDGKSVARKAQVAALDAGLDQIQVRTAALFPPHQVQSALSVHPRRAISMTFASTTTRSLPTKSKCARGRRRSRRLALTTRQLSQARWRDEWWLR